MQYWKSLLLLVTLLFSSLVQAQNHGDKYKKKIPRIQHYFVNPKTDLSWMTEIERATYLNFLYSLNTLIEAELAYDLVIVVPEKVKKRTKKNTMLDYILQIGQPQTAEANGLVSGAASRALIILGEGALMASKTPVGARTMAYLAARRAEAYKAAAMAAETVKVTSDITFSKALKAGLPVALAVTSLSVIPLEDGEMKSTAKTPAKNPPLAAIAPPVAETAKVATVTEEPKSLQVASANPSKQKGAVQSRKEGLFCIFGGHASRYKTAGNRTFCPAPEGTVNSATCERSGHSPNFLCQSMGLSENKSHFELSKKLCIPLESDKGLLDLTVRCSEVFNNDFLPRIRAVDPNQVTVFQKQIEDGIKTLEAERGIEDIGLIEYCEGGNATNKGRQASECDALASMIQAVRKDLPSVAKKADSKVAATSNPSDTKQATPGKSTR